MLTGGASAQPPKMKYARTVYLYVRPAPTSSLVMLESVKVVAVAGRSGDTSPHCWPTLSHLLTTRRRIPTGWFRQLTVTSKPVAAASRLAGGGQSVQGA